MTRPLAVEIHFTTSDQEEPQVIRWETDDDPVRLVRIGPFLQSFLDAPGVEVVSWHIEDRVTIH